MTDRLILVVEDDEELASILTEALSGEGYEVECAPNGLEALQAIQRKRPAAILLDLMMPIMDGWQFREEQMKRPETAAIPVVLMTAISTAREKAKELGTEGYLQKPILLDRLLKEVNRVLMLGAPRER